MESATSNSISMGKSWRYQINGRENQMARVKPMDVEWVYLENDARLRVTLSYSMGPIISPVASQSFTFKTLKPPQITSIYCDVQKTPVFQVLFVTFSLFPSCFFSVLLPPSFWLSQVTWNPITSPFTPDSFIIEVLNDKNGEKYKLDTKGNNKEFILKNERDLPWKSAENGEKFSLKLSYILGKDIKSLDSKTSFSVVKGPVIIKLDIKKYTSTYGYGNRPWYNNGNYPYWHAGNAGYRYEVNIPSNGKYIVWVKTERVDDGMWQACFGSWDDESDKPSKGNMIWYVPKGKPPELAGKWVKSEVAQLTRGKHLWVIGARDGCGYNVPWSQIIVTDKLDYKP